MCEKGSFISFCTRRAESHFYREHSHCVMLLTQISCVHLCYSFMQDLTSISRSWPEQTIHHSLDQTFIKAVQLDYFLTSSIFCIVTSLKTKTHWKKICLKSLIIFPFWACFFTVMSSKQECVARIFWRLDWNLFAVLGIRTMSLTLWSCLQKQVYRPALLFRLSRSLSIVCF